MNAYFVANVPATTLHAALAWGVQQQAWPWLYGEAMLGSALTTLPPLLAGDPPGWQAWTHGRAFGPESELSWRRQEDGRYRLRLLQDSGAPPPGVDWGAGQTWEVWVAPAAQTPAAQTPAAQTPAAQTPAAQTPLPTLLHGTLDDGRSRESGQASWSEARIPRYLTYPVQIDLERLAEDVNVRVTLSVQAYAQHGVVGLTRLCHLAPQMIVKEAADEG
jgi:hypothetical protein